MKRASGALLGLVVLAVALLSPTIDLHGAPHPESGNGLIIDLGAAHAAETGHVEAAGTASDLLCPVCLVLLESVAGPRPAADEGTSLEVRFVVMERPAVGPLSGAACTTSCRAPPPAAV